MYYNLPPHLPKSPIYQKALDIFALSQNISIYLRDDLSYLKNNGEEDENIYVSGDIVQQSVSLGSEIIKVELEHCKEKKHKQLYSLRRLTNRLYRNCIKLEKCNSNGKDYLPILRKELKIFKKLQNHWALTL